MPSVPTLDYRYSPRPFRQLPHAAFVFIRGIGVHRRFHLLRRAHAAVLLGGLGARVCLRRGRLFAGMKKRGGSTPCNVRSDTGSGASLARDRHVASGLAVTVGLHPVVTVRAWSAPRCEDVSEAPHAT
jgi:hypothetical protein